jgi:hypothetical protein
MMEDKAIEIIASSAMQMTQSPEQSLGEAERAAAALRDKMFSKIKPANINGKQYPLVEHWTTVASFYGITAKVTQTNYVEYGGTKGWEAYAEAIRADSGLVISRAEAMCMDDEPRWKGRPIHQLRAMAQTRAVSRCLRNVFSRIMVLAGVEPTPADDRDGTWDAPRREGGFPEDITNLQRLIAMIINVDKSQTGDSICMKYFVPKGKREGEGLPYDEVRKFHTAKQLQWVHGQCKKISEDYKNILPPSAVKNDEEDAELPF